MTSTPSDSHPAVAEGLISPGAWSLVENQFSPFAKETLAKVANFVMVRVGLAGSVGVMLTGENRTSVSLQRTCTSRRSARTPPLDGQQSRPSSMT